MQTVNYVMGAKGIKARTGAAQNAVLWQAVQAQVAQAGAAGVTLAALQATCRTLNNPGFAAYVVRLGWLVPVQPAAQPAAQPATAKPAAPAKPAATK